METKSHTLKGLGWLSLKERSSREAGAGSLVCQDRLLGSYMGQRSSGARPGGHVMSKSEYDRCCPCLKESSGNDTD